MAAVGPAMLFRAGRTLFGSMIFGWGLFNLVGGVIDHHVLHVHNTVERLGASAWDWAFLAVGGIGFMAIGWAIIRSARNDPPRGRLPVAV